MASASCRGVAPRDLIRKLELLTGKTGTLQPAPIRSQQPDHLQNLPRAASPGSLPPVAPSIYESVPGMHAFCIVGDITLRVCAPDDGTGHLAAAHLMTCIGRPAMAGLVHGLLAGWLGLPAQSRQN